MDELSRPQIVSDRLKSESKATLALQKESIRVLWNIDSWDYILKSDTFVNYLIEYLNLSTHHTEFVRYDFYEYSIKFLMQDLNTLEQDILSDLATSMELLQVNSINEKEFKDFLGIRLKNVTESRMEHIIKKILSILETKSRGTEINFQFEHHTIQEFLTAKQILKQENPISYFKKLALVEMQGETFIKSSWSGVLRFLLESSISSELLKFILDLAKNNEDLVDESLANSLATVNPLKVENYASEVFELVFYTFQRKRNWLPIWVSFNLWQFVTDDQLELLKSNIDVQLETETAIFVVRGNIANLIDSILEHEPNRISEQEKNFWKGTLIKFANFEGVKGVLQRESLSALKYFKDVSVIDQVSKAFDNGDKLIKEAFITMCSYIDPNADITIKYIAEGFKKGVALKARYAIYNIKTKKGIKLLLDRFIEEGKFLDEFLDDESIFSRKDEDKGDKQIVDVIRKYAKDKLVLEKLKKLIVAAFSYEKLWNANKSIFLKDIAQIILSHDKNYPFSLLSDIKKNAPKPDYSIYELEEIFALLINKGNLKQFFKKYRELCESRDWVLEKIVYAARTSQGDVGEELFEYALKKGLIRPPAKPKRGEATAGERSVYKHFKKHLQPEPGKYNPQVFEYFNKNEEIIRKRSKPEEIERLKDLVLNTGLSKFLSRKIEVTLGKDESGKRTNQYTITDYASFMGDVFRTALRLCSKKEIEKYRQNIIDFVPFAYSEDVPTINEIIETISENDIEYIHKVYLDKSSDKRYFIPGAYNHFIEKYLKSGVRFQSIFKVLQSFVDDDLIELYVRKEALQKLNRYNSDIDKKWISKLFNQYKNEEGDLFELAELASAILIEKFNDKTAIEWVLAELKRRAKPFKKRMEFHAISRFEDELDGLTFAGAITKIDDDEVFIKLLELLEETQKLQIKEDDYASYSDYVWRIVQAYINNKSIQKALVLSQKTRDFLRGKKYKNTNWLLGALETNFSKIKLQVGVPESVSEAVSLVVKYDSHGN